MKSLLFAQNTSLVLARLLAGAFSTLLITSFLARTLGPEGNGIYALVILCPILAVAIAGLGIGPASVYLIGRGRFGVPEVVAKNIVISLVLAGVIAVVGMPIIYWFGQRWFSNVPQILLAISLLMTFPLLMFGNLVVIFQGIQNFKLHGFFTLLPQVTTAILLILGFWLFDDKLKVAVISWGGGYFFALGAILFLFRTEIREFPQSIQLRSRYINESLHFGLKAHVSNLVTLLNYRIDIYLLGAFAGMNAVGIYAVTVPITEAVWLVSSAASAVLFPMVASLKTDTHSKNITPLISRWVLLVTTLAAVVVILASNLIVEVFFGEAFFESVQVLLFLMPGVVLWAVARVLCNDIAGRGRPDINLYISLSALVVNVIANLILIPKFGVNGAALASSISYSIFAVTVATIYSRLLNVKISELILPTSDDILIIKRVLGNIINRTAR